MATCQNFDILDAWEEQIMTIVRGSSASPNQMNFCSCCCWWNMASQLWPHKYESEIGYDSNFLQWKYCFFEISTTWLLLEMWYFFWARFLGQMVGAGLPALALGCSPSPIQATAALLPSHFSYCFANTVQVLLSRQLLHHTSSAALVWIVLQQAFLHCNTNCRSTVQVLLKNQPYRYYTDKWYVVGPEFSAFSELYSVQFTVLV